MTSTAKALMGTFGMADKMVPLVLDDLTDEQYRSRSRGDSGPSIAWMVGHLLHYRHYLIGLLGGGGESPFGEMFTSDATSGDEYPSADELTRLWAEVAPKLRAAVDAKTEEEWSGPVPGRGGDQSLVDFIAFMAWHEGYHTGMIGTLRKSMGLPGPAEKMFAQRQK